MFIHMGNADRQNSGLKEGDAFRNRFIHIDSIVRQNSGVKKKDVYGDKSFIWIMQTDKTVVL